MKRTKLYTGLVSLTGILVLSLATPALANIRRLTIQPDLDNIDSWTAGVPFLPEFEIEDEDADILHLDIDDAEIANADPTQGYTLHFRLEADDEVIDDDLKITGTGIRAAYVDSVDVDNTSAKGRLLVYPFYQLTEPQAMINTSAKTISWPAVKYAGSYEIVLSYTTKNGSEKTAHFKTKTTSKDISSYLQQAAGGSIGAAVRAIGSDEESWMDAQVKDGSNKATWDVISGAEKYKVRASYTNKQGAAVKKETTTTGTSLDISGYRAASADGNVRITVRAIPSAGNKKYYNLAPSDFALAENSTMTPDTSDYEIDNPWELMADYKAVSEGDFASVSNPTGAYNKGSIGSGDGNWKRVTYKWQYLVNGTPFNGGWKQIGGSWYYFDADGFMHTGWLQDQGKWYYLTSQVGSSTGIMFTGTHDINGKTYNFDNSGACLNK